VVPLGSVDLFVGGGLAFAFVYASVDAPGRSYGAAEVAGGAVASAAAEWPVGPGAVVLGATFGFGSRAGGVVEVLPGGLGVDAGYRIDL
jgi:hypothetical protein